MRQEGRIKTTPAAKPTGPRAVESEAAEEPENSDNHQHGAQRSGDSRAHAAKKQEDNDDKEKKLHEQFRVSSTEPLRIKSALSLSAD